jgi:hypothetical protein
LFLDRMSDGGVQRSFLGLAEAFLAHGCEVDLVLGDRLGIHHQRLPLGMKLVHLTSGGFSGSLIGAWRARRLGWPEDGDRQAAALPPRWLAYLPGLVRYIEEVRPTALLSAKTLANLIALLARERTGRGTRIVISERTHLSESIGRSRRDWKAELLPDLVRRLYPMADGVVAISSEVAADLATMSGLDSSRVRTIHNGLLRSEAVELPASDHPWRTSTSPLTMKLWAVCRAKASWLLSKKPVSKARAWPF